MKIIFLDIDGVLNHEQFYKNRNRHEKEYPLSEICPKSVANLNVLIAETGAKVVISSTWRMGRTATEMQVLLEGVGFTGEVIDCTPIFKESYTCRGDEILQWTKSNKELLDADYYNFTEYVILDDDSDMLYWQRNNFLLIDRFVGLTMGAVFQAKKMLNNGKILNSNEL